MANKPEDIFVATIRPENNEQSILILTADNTEDLEFFYPYYRFIEAGFRVDVATPKGGEFKGKNGSGLKSTQALEEVSPESYDLLYIPGGKAPAALKKIDEAVALVKRFAATGKPIAAICHGPQLLAEADVISGKRISAWPECEDEVQKAGAIYVDQPTIVDGQFITARWPGDLPSHLARTLQALNRGASFTGSSRLDENDFTAKPAQL